MEVRLDRREAEPVIIAKLFRGPADGQVLTLPPEAATSVIVIPQFEPITIEFVYLLAGKQVDHWAYLYDEEYEQVKVDES